MAHAMLVTGASGFVGRCLTAELQQRGHAVRVALRNTKQVVGCAEAALITNINAETDWTDALRGIDTVFHLAARVHVMKDDTSDPLAEFRKVNLHGTENLARQAVRAGVKRLVYVSSIKVNGEGSESTSYTERDSANPQDPYGVSKWEAEQALHRIADETGLEVVIVRPPLVYGPGVKGNFISLFKAIDKGLPLPLAGARNARSLVYVGNLADALIACATRVEAAGQTYLVSDGDAVSTADLVSGIARALECRGRCFYFPPVILRVLARLLGKSAQVDRLFGSLRVDSSKLRQQLGWAPPYTLQQGLLETARWYRQQRQ